MWRASSSRVTSKFREARMVCAEWRRDRPRSPPSIAAIGTSNFGSRRAASFGRRYENR